MKIIQDKANELLDRKEVKIIIEAPSNPSMGEASKKIAEQFKAEEDNIVIKEIQGKFGRNTFLISALIYDNKEAREKIERKLKGDEKKEEKPAEEKKEPVAAKEPEAKEEPKPEEKQDNKESEKTE